MIYKLSEKILCSPHAKKCFQTRQKTGSPILSAVSASPSSDSGSETTGTQNSVLMLLPYKPIPAFSTTPPKGVERTGTTTLDSFHVPKETSLIRRSSLIIRRSTTSTSKRQTENILHPTPEAYRTKIQAGYYHDHPLLL